MICSVKAIAKSDWRERERERERERGDRETVLGTCYFCHYFVIQHYITLKIHNCWNLIAKKNYYV